MFGWFRKRVPSNVRVVPAITTVPDPYGVQAASLGLITNTFSPASSGLIGGSKHPGPAGSQGLSGVGVNRWAGADPRPVQSFIGAAAPVADPKAQRLGFGSGVSGQPGLPSTGDQTGGLAFGTPAGLGMGG